MRTDSDFNKPHKRVTVRQRGALKWGLCVSVCVRESLYNRLAFLIIVALVLIPEQRLVALLPVRPGTHSTRGESENDRDDHKGSDYGHGYYFAQGEIFTWKGRSKQ